MRKYRSHGDELSMRRQSGSSTTCTYDSAVEEEPVEAANPSEKVRRTRNPGNAASKSLRTLTKAESYPVWGTLPRVYSGFKEVVPFSRQEEHQDVFKNRRSSVPWAFGTTRRKSLFGGRMSAWIPPSLSLMIQEEDDDEIWFTSIDDFRHPAIVLARSSLRITYFVKAVVCRKNFILHVYSHDHLSSKQGKQVRRLVDFMQWLRHRHIVKCVGAWETDSAFYIVEEYCHRASLLHQLVTNRKQFTEAFVIEHVLRPLLDALVYLHQMSIAHRGIRPENIHFGKGNVLRLSGFISAIEYARSRPCSRLGPLDYAPPEMLKMAAINDSDAEDEEEELLEYDEKVDVWQVGILTYEMLRGMCPFENLGKEFSSGAIDFIQRALMKQPDKRPSMLDLASHPWLQPRRPTKGPAAFNVRSGSVMTTVKKWASSIRLPKEWLSLFYPYASRDRKHQQQVLEDDSESTNTTDDGNETRLMADPKVNRLTTDQEISSILNIDLDNDSMTHFHHQPW